jgi:hypothetical protein
VTHQRIDSTRDESLVVDLDLDVDFDGNGNVDRDENL